MSVWLMHRTKALPMSRGTKHCRWTWYIVLKKKKNIFLEQEKEKKITRKWLQRSTGPSKKNERNIEQTIHQFQCTASVPVTNTPPVNPTNANAREANATNQSTANVDDQRNAQRQCPKGQGHIKNTANVRMTSATQGDHASEIPSWKGKNKNKNKWSKKNNNGNIGRTTADYTIIMNKHKNSLIQPFN